MNYSDQINSTLFPPNTMIDSRTRVQIVIQASSMAGFIFCSIFGNVLILLAVYTNYQLQEITSVFIVNLACADLLLALIGMPFTVVSSITFDWIFGEELCSFHGMVNFIFAAGSVLSLAAVAIERYVAIIKPMKYHSIMTHRTVAGMIVFIWVDSLFGALLPVMGWSRYSYLQMESMCTYNWPYSPSNTIFMIIKFFATPLSVIVYCYYHILKVARDHSRRIQVPIVPYLEEECSKTREQIPQVAFEMQDPVVVESLKERQQRHKADTKYKKEAKAAKTLMLVMGTFIFCWAPHIIGMISLLVPGSKWPKEFFAATTWLAMMNSACNPIIYGLLNRRFRESFKKILHCGRANFNS